MNCFAKAWLYLPVSALATSAAFAQQSPEDAAPADQEIVVTGTRGSLNSSRNVERKSDGFVSAVSSDEAGQFPDQNVAETLQRLSGVSISRSEGEGRFVSVRGLDPSFNNVTVNGVKLGSTEKSDGSVALDIIPSDLLDSINVIKTSTPDLDGDAIGGTIEVKSLSAFDRKNAIRLRLEGGINDIRGKINPKASAQFTRLFDVGGTSEALGIALAASYFDRAVQSDDLRNDEGLICNAAGRASGSGVSVNASGGSILPCPIGSFLRPQEIDQRVLIGDRERYGATLNIEFRPSDSQSYFIRGTATQLNDDQTRFQQEIEPRRATDRRDIRAAGPRSFTLDGVDFERQVFFQDFTDKLYALSAGGENKFENWTVNYQGDWSRITRTSDGERVRFRERRGILTFTADEDSVEFTPAAGIRRAGDPRVLANYDLDQVLLDRETGRDQIYSGKIDLSRKLELGSSTLTFKVGGKYRKREKRADVDEFLIEDTPTILALGAGLIDATPTLADFPTSSVSGTRLFGFNDFPTAASLRPVTQQFAERAPPAIAATAINSAREDFSTSEDVSAGYALATLDVGDATRVIAGVRIENTKLRTNGNFVFDVDGTTVGDIVLANPRGRNEYTDILPSVVVRHNTGDWQLRGAVTTAIQRPNFEDISGVQTGTQTDTGFRSISLTNPNLDPARALQLDVGAAWYPNRNTAIQLTGFYKRLNDFIADVTINGGRIDQITGVTLPLPATLTPAQLTFNDISVSLNGRKAEIYGVEFAYNQSFTQLPGVLKGLFASFNVTYADSKARLDLRPNENLQFPGQPKWVGNLSVGWENEEFQLRVSGNYRDDVILSYSDSPIEDVLRPEFFSLDVGLRFTFIPGLQIYFDANNLLAERDERFFRGDQNGGFFERIERFGRTFQLGARVKF